MDTYVVVINVIKTLVILIYMWKFIAKTACMMPKECKVNVEFIPSLSENKPVAAIMFPQDSKITNTNGIENWNV